MSWLERPETKKKNPAVKFLEWSSNNKCFTYYDKEKEETVQVELPLKFVILEHYHTVKGWNDKSGSRIFSNEVLFLGTEELKVKSFKGGEIADGLYKEIKSKVSGAGGHYARSIYAVTTDLELVNISLKGSAVAKYSDFIQEFGDNNFDKSWVVVKEAQDMKKGAVSYTVPVFEKAQDIKDTSKIMPFADSLMSYMVDYKENESSNTITKTQTSDNQVDDDDEVPF
jgi:hypothetical protein